MNKRTHLHLQKAAKLTSLSWEFARAVLTVSTFSEKDAFLENAFWQNKRDEFVGDCFTDTWEFFKNKPSVRESALFMSFFPFGSFYFSYRGFVGDNHIAKDPGTFFNHERFASFLCKNAVIAPFDTFKYQRKRDLRSNPIFIKNVFLE